MQLGMIGLGRMGANMVRRLMNNGHECVVYDHDPKAIAALAAEKATGSSSLDDFVARLKPPRAVWLMVPAAVVDQTLDLLATAATPTTSTTSAARRRSVPPASTTSTRAPAAVSGASSAATA